MINHVDFFPCHVFYWKLFPSEHCTDHTANDVVMTESNVNSQQQKPNQNQNQNQNKKKPKKQNQNQNANQFQSKSQPANLQDVEMTDITSNSNINWDILRFWCSSYVFNNLPKICSNDEKQVDSVKPEYVSPTLETKNSLSFVTMSFFLSHVCIC